ncbi:hypothetical protein [Halosimplex halobium]|uniref:hypothetical protein n=1 Tax=Halosimplex halobium TaxID=3396618 RepID=UPI003F560EDE
MDRGRVAVYAAAAVIVAVTVLSGPAVGLVDLTTPRYDMSGLGEGSAAVDEVDLPSSVSLDRGYQSQSYYLTVPDARVRFATVEGKPTVAYGIDIPALGYSRSTTHFLRDGDAGWASLSLREDTFAEDAVDADRYEGELSLVVRDSDGKSVVANRTVPVEVRE